MAAAKSFTTFSSAGQPFRLFFTHKLAAYKLKRLIPLNIANLVDSLVAGFFPKVLRTKVPEIKRSVCLLRVTLYGNFWCPDEEMNDGPNIRKNISLVRIPVMFQHENEAGRLYVLCCMVEGIGL